MPASLYRVKKSGFCSRSNQARIKGFSEVNKTCLYLYLLLMTINSLFTYIKVCNVRKLFAERLSEKGICHI